MLHLEITSLVLILPKKEIITEIEGRKLKLSNLNKPLYPEVGIVKAELIQYYLRIAPYILPHLKNRPLTLIRYPDGIQSNRFYSKNRPNWTPDWVECIQIEVDDENTYAMANDLPSLVWMANLAALELHPMQTTALLPHSPDHFIFDLDPPETADFEVVKQLALRLKPFLESHGYQPFVKTSGSKGLHVYVPISQEYEQSVVLDCVKKLAKQYVGTDKTTTLKMSKEKRKGKVLLDIYRNHKSQTCVAPYSTRGKLGAPISTPIFWTELENLTSSQAFTIRNIFDKIDSVGDPWKDFKSSARPLHKVKSTHPVKKIQRSTHISLKGKKSTINAIELKPMLATLGRAIPDRNKYSYEIKWDGIRVIIIKENQSVRVMSRKGNDITEKFPLIYDYMLSQDIESFIVDGELMVMNSDGTPNFSKVVGRMHLNGKQVIKRASKKDKTVVYLFDVLYFDGQDIRNKTLESRKNWLKENIQWNEQILYSESFDNGSQLLEAIRTKNMEGIMCKLKKSKYESNKRSSSWIKVKVQNEDQAMIIGYTKGKGDRAQLFGALHLAKKDKEKLVYMGKVGTGFNQSKIKEIIGMISKIEQTKKLISDTIEDEKNTIWIIPSFSCELKFASMTSNNTYREPVFLNIHKTADLL